MMMKIIPIKILIVMAFLGLYPSSLAPSSPKKREREKKELCHQLVEIKRLLVSQLLSFREMNPSQQREYLQEQKEELLEKIQTHRWNRRKLHVSNFSQNTAPLIPALISFILFKRLPRPKTFDELRLRKFLIGVPLGISALMVGARFTHHKDEISSLPFYENSQNLEKFQKHLEEVERTLKTKEINATAIEERLEKMIKGLNKKMAQEMLPCRLYIPSFRDEYYFFL